MAFITPLFIGNTRHHRLYTPSPPKKNNLYSGSRYLLFILSKTQISLVFLNAYARCRGQMQSRNSSAITVQEISVLEYKFAVATLDSITSVFSFVSGRRMLSPRSVLITGANRGIGLELTRQLLSLKDPPEHIFATCRQPEGATVIITCSSSSLRGGENAF